MNIDETKFPIYSQFVTKKKLKSMQDLILEKGLFYMLSIPLLLQEA